MSKMFDAVDYLFEEIKEAQSRVDESKKNEEKAKKECGAIWLDYEQRKKYNILCVDKDITIIKENAKKVRKLLLKLY